MKLALTIPEKKTKSIDLIIYESMIKAACDNVYKFRWITGQVSLYQYLLWEARVNCGDV